MTGLDPARAPARTARVGAFAFDNALRAALLLCLLATAGCDRMPRVGGGDDGPRVLELAHDTIRLEGGVRLIDVAVRRRADGDFDPPHVEARTGDVVRFTSEDRGGHAVVFLGAELQPEAREFLERSGQMRSPPFITDGASWVITLDGAPAGVYPFHCTTHDVRGQLTVAQRE